MCENHRCKTAFDIVENQKSKNISNFCYHLVSIGINFIKNCVDTQSNNDYGRNYLIFINKINK